MTGGRGQRDLFDAAPGLPEGFVYEPEFITSVEEASLLAAIRELPLAEAKYREFTARRRTVSYGGQYNYCIAETRDLRHPITLRTVARR